MPGDRLNNGSLGIFEEAVGVHETKHPGIIEVFLTRAMRGMYAHLQAKICRHRAESLLHEYGQENRVVRDLGNGSSITIAQEADSFQQSSLGIQLVSETTAKNISIWYIEGPTSQHTTAELTHTVGGVSTTIKLETTVAHTTLAELRNSFGEINKALTEARTAPDPTTTLQ